MKDIDFDSMVIVTLRNYIDSPAYTDWEKFCRAVAAIQLEQILKERRHMKEEVCPKCDAVVEPRWHKGMKEDGVTPGCGKTDGFKSNREHLHFYCKCGFDFIRPIEDKDAGIVEF